MITAGRIRELATQAPNEKVYPDQRFPPSIYYRFMKLLAAEIQPTNSVVLGVCGGGDCLHLAQGWPAGQVYGVDYARDHVDNIKHVEATFPNFHFLWNDSIDVIKSFDKFSGPCVDILFIDTIHTYERTIREFYAWQRVLNPGAVVMLDDLYRDGMLAAWTDLPGAKIRLDELHLGGSPTDGGFGVILL